MENHCTKPPRTRTSTTETTSVFTGSRQEDHTAFAEEISVSAVYRWSLHFTTQIGL